MTAIYKRELRALFHSFIGWLFLAACFLMMGIYFTAYNMLMGYPSIAYVLQSVIFLFMIAIPILTMRILAEDRRQKTDQLILTAPVSVSGIVFGKYLALLTFFAIPAAVIGITPLILSRFGTFQMGESYVALLGFFLYGALGLAIGLLFSSLTESIVIAAVLTFTALFLGYLMPGVCSIISQSGNFLTNILGAFDMVGRFDAMAGGSLYVPSVVYFLTLTILILLYAIQSIQKRRYSISGKGIRLGNYSIGLLIVSTALTVVVNILVLKLPENMISIDVTSNKMYSITKDTKKLVEALPEDVTVYVLADEETKDANLDITLQKMADLSKHLTVRYVDPAVNPMFYRDYAETEPTANSLIVVGPMRSRVVDYSDIYEYEMDYTYYNYQITGYDGEGQIMSAIAYVTTDDMPKIYVVVGHGELELEGAYTRSILKENIEYEELSLLTVDKIPEDAQALIMDAPIRDYSDDDVEKIISYLEEGNNALIIPTQTEETLTNFEKILEFYGVSTIDGMIFEADTDRYYAQIPFYIFPKINYDEITSGIYDAAVFAPYSQGLSYQSETGEIMFTPLLETSDEAYSKVDLESVAEDYRRMDEDIAGPLTLALKAEKQLAGGAVSQAVIVATENLFTEDADGIVPGNNVKLFGGIVSALAAHESSVSIPVKYFDTTVLAFTTRTVYFVGVFAILLLPAGCLLAGFAIWFYRRRK